MDTLTFSAREIEDFLKSINPIRCATAIWSITQQGDNDKLEILIEKLQDKDPIVRIYTLYGAAILGKGNPKYIRYIQNAPEVEVVPDVQGKFFNDLLQETINETMQLLSVTPQ